MTDTIKRELFDHCDPAQQFDAETYPWAGEASEGRAMYYRFANSILSLFTAGRDEGEIK